MGGPHVWIVGSFLEHPFRDACHCFSQLLLDMERNRWVFGFFTLLRSVWHSVIVCPSCYVGITFQNINIRGRGITRRQRGSLTTPIRVHRGLS
jgi:hypothetical protein